MKRTGCKAGALSHLWLLRCVHLSASIAIHGDAKRIRSVLHWLCVVAVLHATIWQGSGGKAWLPTLGQGNWAAQF
jgi:hypothetical protein